MWPRQRTSGHGARPSVVARGRSRVAGAAGAWAAITASGESAGRASAPIAAGAATAGALPRLPPSGVRRQRLDARESALRRILRRTLRQTGPASGAWVFDFSDRQVLFNTRTHAAKPGLQLEAVHGRRRAAATRPRRPTRDRRTGSRRATARPHLPRRPVPEGVGGSEPEPCGASRTCSPARRPARDPTRDRPDRR